MQLFISYVFNNEETNKVIFKNKIMLVDINTLSEITSPIIKKLEEELEVYEEDLGTVTILNYKCI